VGVRIHGIATNAAAAAAAAHLVKIFDKADVQRTATVFVVLELRDRSVGIVTGIEPNDTGAARSSTRLILNFCLLDLANCREELDEILITG